MRQRQLKEDSASLYLVAPPLRLSLDCAYGSILFAGIQLPEDAPNSSWTLRAHRLALADFALNFRIYLAAVMAR